MCFNEPLNDTFGYWGKKGTDAASERTKWDANHQFLERHDFAEIVDAWDAIMHVYPMYYQFQDYLPPHGVLPQKLHCYFAALMDFAASRGRRTAICEIFTRGRAGALRGAFGGFHVAQYRDPFSQFGSFYRPLQDAGEWYFLVFPLLELGINGHHPLYATVPEAWRLPVVPWPADDPSQRWASTLEYLAIAASPLPGTIEKLFRWHLFAWFLSNLAAVCYSDLAFDIDKSYDDPVYRRSIVDALAAKIGVIPDFSGLTKFSRYYDFEGLDVTKVSDQVAAAITSALRDGRLDEAVRALGSQAQVMPTAAGFELLMSKIHDSLANMQKNTDCRSVSFADWKAIAESHQRIWFNPYFRFVGRHVYRFGSPVLRTARRAGILH